MVQGILASGDRVVRVEERHYTGKTHGDVAVFYGLEGNLTRIFSDYAARAVYVDLGYWGRREGGRWSGYHKVVVGDRHPTQYFQRRVHDGSRFDRFHVEQSPWQKSGHHILLAGMGDKGATAEGFAVEEFERWAIAEIRKVSTRPIIYRPKPSWKKAKPIAGVGYSARTEEAEQVLAGAWAVVTHHSNVAVDGLLKGIPSFCWYGVAMPMSLQDLAQIEKPWRPDGREQWARDIAWCQWSISEMKGGLAWQHLKAEGLI